MIDTFIKLTLFISGYLAIDCLVRKGFGYPLHEGIVWSARHRDIVNPVLLGFALLVLVTFLGLFYGVSKDLYQALVSRPQATVFLGYHHGKEHYIDASFFYPGPGEVRLDRVYRPDTILKNPVSGHYWPRKELKTTWLFLFFSLVCLVFVGALFSHVYLPYLASVHPEVLPDPMPAKSGYAFFFLKKLFEAFKPYALPMGAFLAASLFFSIRFTGIKPLAEKFPLPPLVRPGEILTARLVDTYFKGTNTTHFKEADDRRYVISYYAIFEFVDLFPQPVWVAAYLGRSDPFDKDDGVYGSLDDEYEKRTDYENAEPLFKKLQGMAERGEIFRLRVRETLMLDWTVDSKMRES